MMEDVDIKEIFNMFWAKKVHIVLIVLIFVVIGALYSYLYVVPEYKSYTTLVLATAVEDSTTSSGTMTEITLSNNLVSTYSELIRSKTTIRQVIGNLGISKKEDALRNSISVTALKNTQLIQINVVDKDPYQAKIIANELAKVFIEKVSELYNMNNVHVEDEAEESNVPYNINHTKDLGMFTFIGIIVSCIYILIANMLDTTVKNKEDVEKKLGLTVLVTIPTCNFEDLPKSPNRGGRAK